MARVPRNWLLRAARIPLSVIWNHVWDVVRTTVSRTRNGNCCAVSRLTASTAAERTSPVTAERAPAMSMSRRMRARGRSARGMNRTSPLSSPRMPIDVTKEESPTRVPAIPTALALNNRAAKAQKTNPREEFANAATRTQPPCSRTIAESSIGPVDTVGSTQGNSHPVITPTNRKKDGEAIRLPRKGDARDGIEPRALACDLPRSGERSAMRPSRYIELFRQAFPNPHRRYQEKKREEQENQKG